MDTAFRATPIGHDEQRCLFRWYRIRHRHEGGGGQRDVLGETAVPAVADTGSDEAAVFVAVAAALASAAGGSEQTHDPVARLEVWSRPAPSAATVPGNFVPEDYIIGDAAAKHSAHDQEVVMAESAGVDAQQRLAGAGRGSGSTGYDAICGGRPGLTSERADMA